jgi:hypothetical protein
MAADYFPPRSVSVPWLTIVTRADPDWQSEQKKQLEFEFSNGRQFFHNPTTRGPYED